MSTVFRKAVLGGGLAIAGVAAVGVSFTVHAEPAQEAAACEVALLPGRDGDTLQFSAGMDATGRYVAGMTYDKDRNKAAALWKDDKIEIVGTPDGVDDPQLRDVNSHGQAIGNYWEGEKQRNFVYADGEVTVLDDEGQERSDVVGINDDGAIIGLIAKTKEDYDPVVWDANNPTEKGRHLDKPDGATGASARVIDEEGDIAGSSYPGDGAPRFWKGGEGKPESLPVPSDGKVDGLSPTNMAGDWLLAAGGDGPDKIDYVYAPDSKDPVEYTTVENPTDITPEGWVSGEHKSRAAIASPDGELTELPTPEGFDQAAGANITGDHSVIVGDVAAGEEKNSIAKWTCK